METIFENWEKILESTCKEHNVSSVSFDAWLRPLKPVKMVDDTIYIVISESQGRMAIDYLNIKYKLPLQVAIGEFINRMCDIVFVLPEDLEKEKTEIKKEKEFEFNSSPYTFENFIVSNNNRFAYSAALAVAESPGEVYNPLFLYSGVGLGKTHLMHSIVHYINKTDSSKNVLYVTSEAFTNELIEAIRNGNNNSISKFRDKYRNIDVLLIDDIQFIIDKDRTQEEFFHTFNHLHLLKKQIVISSDKPPKDISPLEERLRTRFEMGLIADISSPDYETRMAILEKNLEKKGYEMDEKILVYIASNVKSNIRELNGALNKLIAFTQLERDKELTLEVAERELKDIISPDAPKTITPDFIVQTVCDHYNVTTEDICSQKRSATINLPRQIIMYLCREIIGMPLKSIGNMLGGRDHTTVMHGADKIADELTKNETVYDAVNILKKKINP